MEAIRRQINTINLVLLLLMACALPWSTSAVTVIALLLVLGWLIEGKFEAKWLEVRTNPVCIALLVFLGSYLLGLLWTQDLEAGWDVLRKQWKLALLPVFLTLVNAERRWWYIAAGIGGITALMVVVYLASFGIIEYGEVNAKGQATLIGNQIVYTPMLALAAYLMLHQVLWAELKSWQRGALMLLALLLVGAVFITRGRAGQVVFFVLMGLLIFQWHRTHLLKAAAWTLVLAGVISTSAYSFSPLFRQRIQLIVQDIREFDRNPETSVGLRLQFWQNSLQVIRQAPWYGVGTGDFTAAYAEVNQKLSPKMPNTDNPHNQYLLVTVQTGFLGLASLLALFGVQILVGRRTDDEWQRIRLAFPLFFLSIMMTDSYLNTHSSGFLFSLYSAVLYKGAVWSVQATRQKS